MRELVCCFVRQKLTSLIVCFIFIVCASYLILVDREQHVTQSLSSHDLHRSILKPHRRTSMLRFRSSQSPSKVKIKVILLWSPLFKEWADMGFLSPGTFNGSVCQESRCEITTDRRRLLESDAVVFHVRTLSLFDVPRNRSRRQKWIFFSMEAPPYSRFHGLDFMFGMFNWTMSYRSDSDIVVPYGRIVREGRRLDISGLRENWALKSKMAVWMVSHCSTDSGREKYVDQLKNFVEVDTYGSCGFASCPLGKTDLCVERFSKEYFFFLAFENAICEDYVTEKLFRTLRYSMIPVVMGGGNYSAVAPEHSFVDALSFQSPKHLAARMIQIASNFTEFSSYFLWRSEGYSLDNPYHCDLCEKLHSEDFEKESSYGNINEWWVKSAKCRSWRSG